MGGQRGKKKSGKKKSKSAHSSQTEGTAFVLTLTASLGFNSSAECVAEVISAETGQNDGLSVDRADLSEFLQWFVTGLETEPHARLSFSNNHNKEDRAIIHRLVQSKFSSQLETLSEGVEDTRSISIFSKGQAPRKQLSVEDSSKAAALYTLTRDHLEHGQLSKDEIAEMILTGSLKEELEALWNNKKLDLAASSALLAAIVSGDPLAMKSAVEDAKDLIRRGAPLLATLEMPLHVAVRGGHLDALKALLSAGAPLEAKDGNGRTALQVSRTFEQCEAEGILLQAGAFDPDAKLFPLSATLEDLRSSPAASRNTPPPPSTPAPPHTVPSVPLPKDEPPVPPAPPHASFPKAVTVQSPSPSCCSPSANQAESSSTSPQVSSLPLEVEKGKDSVTGLSSQRDARKTTITPKEALSVSGPALGLLPSIPGWSTVSGAMTWAQDPANAAVVMAGASCVMGVAALMLFGPRRGGGGLVRK